MRVANRFNLALLFVGVILSLVFLSNPNTSLAQFGSCSEYGMAYASGDYCNCMAGYVMGTNLFGDPYCISEDQACKDQYGRNAKSSYTGGCECRYGYVFGTSMFGEEQCVDADSVCTDKYGYGSEYDNLSGSCDCRYGYVWGENGQCITDDQACKDQLGIHARSTYGDQCQCSYGYIIDGGKCTNGDTVCRRDHGIYASYDDLSNRCECDQDYVFSDDMQCVEKNNSAYFTLLDISEDGDELIVESQNDFQKYVIEFGTGCWDYAIESYETDSLVINMGTDFSVDLFDTLVLPNHDQNCSILSVDWTSDYTFDEEVQETFIYNPSASMSVPVPAPETYAAPDLVVQEQNVETVPEVEIVPVIPNEELPDADVLDTEVIGGVESEVQSTTSEQSEVPELPQLKQGFMSRIFSFISGLFN